mmetsp:Transcript_21026/g.68036  ORF Transcript_21026/g.68036 Transcript_21026/m.68036 type:complete len:253 (-) Transcript_21026:213-971(-)
MKERVISACIWSRCACFFAFGLSCLAGLAETPKPSSSASRSLRKTLSPSSSKRSFLGASSALEPEFCFDALPRAATSTSILPGAAEDDADDEDAGAEVDEDAAGAPASSLPSPCGLSSCPLLSPFAASASTPASSAALVALALAPATAPVLFAFLLCFLAARLLNGAAAAAIAAASSAASAFLRTCSPSKITYRYVYGSRPSTNWMCSDSSLHPSVQMHAAPHFPTSAALRGWYTWYPCDSLKVFLKLLKHS